MFLFLFLTPTSQQMKTSSGLFSRTHTFFEGMFLSYTQTCLVRHFIIHVTMFFTFSLCFASLYTKGFMYKDYYFQKYHCCLNSESVPTSTGTSISRSCLLKTSCLHQFVYIRSTLSIYIPNDSY